MAEDYGADVWCENVYTHDGGVHLSDERKKQDIANSDLGLDFINVLSPRSYKWKDTEAVVRMKDTPKGEVEKVDKRAWSYKRTHYGLIAQEVKKVMDDTGLSSEDFGGWIYEESEDCYALRYTEFIAPLIKAVQELSAKVAALEAQIN